VPQNRGPIPSGFEGHSRLLLLEIAARVLATGNQKLCKTTCQTEPKGGTKRKHGNH
jgi:hypothetical protein